MDLVKIELDRNKIGSYIKKSLIICGVMLLIMLFIFCDQEIYKNRKALLENWPSMIYIVSLMSLCSYAILAAVMYSKFVVTEYSGKAAILLFSYPIKRSKIVNAKSSIITAFIGLSIVISNVVIYAIFLIASSLSNPGEIIIYKDHIIYMMQMISISIIFSGVIGIVSGFLGISGNSVQTTIVSAIILCIIATQIIGYIYSGKGDAINYTNLVAMLDAIMVGVGVIIYKMLEHKINIMELDN